MKTTVKNIGFMFIAALLLLSMGGCLVGGEKYDQAGREAEEYHDSLQDMRLANDRLNRDITVLYDEYESLNSQVTTLAALNLHYKYAEGLKRSEPVMPTQPNIFPPPPIKNGSAAQGGKGKPAAGGSSSAVVTSASSEVEDRPIGVIDWGSF